MSNKIFNRQKNYSIKDKDMAMKDFTREILSKTTQIFEYENLPEDLEGLTPVLESFLQQNGNVFFHKVKGILYFFTGGLGGEYDAYYRPTLYTIANPYLNYSTQAKIGEEGVLMRNDTFNQGLLPIIEKYGTLLIESNISINNAIVNTRDYNAFSAQDDKTRASAELYQKRIEDGETHVIAERAMIDSLKRYPTPPLTGSMTELKELRQYIKAQLFSDLGMKTAHNMKSQYVSDAENIINDDTLLPLVQDMLRQRKMAIEEINKMFDLDIKVELSGTWKLQQEKVDLEIDMLEEGKMINGESIEGDIEEEIEEQTDEDNHEETETTEEAKEAEEDEQETTEEDIDIDIEINIDNDEAREPMEVLEEELQKLEGDNDDDEETKPSN